MVEAGRNIRLMDMGISFVAATSDGNVSGYYQAAGNNSESGLQGTPKYAAPEQFGEEYCSGTINASTDIYEFGITLYELLTGFNPFMGKSLEDMFRKHMNSELTASQGVSRRVLEVLRKATAVNQANRYQNVRELRRDLESALNYKPSIWDKLRDKMTK